MANSPTVAVTLVDRVAKKTSHAITAARSHRAPNNMRKAWRRRWGRFVPMEKIWEAVDKRDNAVKSAEAAAMTAQTEYISQDELSNY